MDDLEKTRLTGSIYPAIQRCVNNRYKIIVGYFAIVAFLVAKGEVLARFIKSGALVFTSIIFTFFIVLNSINYWLNAREQWKIEEFNKKVPIVEVLASIVMIILIWGGFFLLRAFNSA